MLSHTLAIAKTVIDTSNEILEDYSPVTIIALMLFIQKAPAAASWAYKMYAQWDTRNIINAFSDGAIKLALETPLRDIVKKSIKKEVTKNLISYKSSSDQSKLALAPIIRTLPEKGMTAEDIVKLYPDSPTDLSKGSLSGGIYTEYPPDLAAAIEKIYGKVALTNPMHPVFKDIKKKEAEVLSITKNLFHAPAGAHAILTYGGTFSIFEGLKAYVLHARKIKGIEKPHIILARSAHPAFSKAIEILNAEAVFVDVDQKGQANVAQIKKAITSKTCLIVASAPSFPHGVCDDVEKIAAIGRNNKNLFNCKNPIPVFVDQCLGGWFTPFAEKLGIKLPVIDFRIPGVDAISADAHKYGYADKGVSMVMFRNDPHELLRPTPTHTFLNSPVGSYVTPGLAGSRSGHQVASAHTVFLYFGEAGYMKRAQAIYDLTQKLKKRIREEIPDIDIPYQTEFPIIGMRTNGNINALVVIDVMKDMTNHWELNTLLTHEFQSDGFHFCITALHTMVEGFADKFIDDLKYAVNYVKQHPERKPNGVAKAYGLLATGAVPLLVQELIGQGYVEIDQSLPGDKIASIDENTVYLSR